MDPIIQEDVERVINTIGDGFRALSGKTILITGANGFVPSYFVDTVIRLNASMLRDDPAQLLLVTRRASQKNERISHCVGNQNVRFLVHDVSVPYEIQSGVDYIIHAASPASPSAYMKHPLNTIDTNVTGVRVLLGYARGGKVNGLLFISSGEVYGDPGANDIPIREEYYGKVNPIGPRSSYQESKRFAETLCYTFWKEYGVQAKIARLFHTYGPRMALDDGRVIPEFMKTAFAGHTIEVRGPHHIRTFSYISDAINAMWRVLLLGKSGEAYNVGSDEEISILDLANLYAKIFGGAIHATITGNAIANMIDAPQKTTPSLEKIKKELGYAPHASSLEEGLRRLKKWYQTYGNVPS